MESSKPFCSPSPPTLHVSGHGIPKRDLQMLGSMTVCTYCSVNVMTVIEGLQGLGEVVVAAESILMQFCRGHVQCSQFLCAQAHRSRHIIY